MIQNRPWSGPTRPVARNGLYREMWENQVGNDDDDR